MHVVHTRTCKKNSHTHKKKKIFDETVNGEAYMGEALWAPASPWWTIDYQEILRMEGGFSSVVNRWVHQVSTNSFKQTVNRCSCLNSTSNKTKKYECGKGSLMRRRHPHIHGGGKDIGEGLYISTHTKLSKNLTENVPNPWKKIQLKKILFKGGHKYFT